MVNPDVYAGSTRRLLKRLSGRQSFVLGTALGKWTRRSFLLGSGAALGVAGSSYLSESEQPVGQPYPLLDASQQSADAVLNDASLLNPTKVAKHLILNARPNESFIAGLRAELLAAKSAKRPFAAGGARHSMGGQSLARNGTAVTLDQNWLEPDTAARTYRVAAGMRWNKVIAALDGIGFSPKVMQSNNDFGVAGTFCVNAHGWPVRFGPFGSTVRSLKLMGPSGDLVTCSRSENAELFELSLGGYGLTGVVTELEVEMVPNARLVPRFEVMPAHEFGERFVAALNGDPDIQMAYGRMDVSLRSFFDEAVMVTYAASEDQGQLPSVAGPGFLSHASRPVLRGQLGSDRMKSLRWFIETQLGPHVASSAVTRNSLVNVPVATLEDREPERTDILHEYFVSPGRFPEFLAACKAVIPSSFQQLLNVTLRFVDADRESLLSYATEARIAAVMLFSQEMSERGESDMARMTRNLIERVIDIGGTYYLPYRLHATDQQFRKGYPRAEEFAVRKREIDPDLLFRNALWERYLAGF